MRALLTLKAGCLVKTQLPRSSSHRLQTKDSVHESLLPSLAHTQSVSVEANSYLCIGLATQQTTNTHAHTHTHLCIGLATQQITNTHAHTHPYGLATQQTTNTHAHTDTRTLASGANTKGAPVFFTCSHSQSGTGHPLRIPYTCITMKSVQVCTTYDHTIYHIHLITMKSVQVCAT
jgi:hypothetical protein